MEYLQTRGWTTDIDELREGAYLVAGTRATDSAPKNMLLLIVCDPAEEVTREHVKYLLTATQRKDGTTAALTSNVPSTNEAKQAIEQYGISILNPDTVFQKADSKNETSTRNSHTEGQRRENAYEVYGSRLRMVLFGLGGLVLGVGAVGILLAGGGGWIVTITTILGVALFLGGGAVMLSRGIKDDPVLRITENGITYNKPIVASEFYPWNNIEQISRVEQVVGKRTIRRSTQTHLQIRVSRPDSSASELSNQADKAALGDDTDAHYLPMSSFGIEFDDVAEAIERYSDVPVIDET